MINVGELARRLGTVVGRTGSGRSGRQVTPELVLECLRPLSATARAQLEIAHGTALLEDIDRALSSLPQLVVEERLVRRHPGFARYFEALPRIVFMHCRGHSSEEIAGRVHFLASDYGVDAVLRLVAETVAKRLSRA